MFNANSGYQGWSMSNRAVQAYDSGEKPLSKWNKKSILEEVARTIDYVGLEVKFDIKKLESVKVNVLKEKLLSYSSYHHTSSYFNTTDFYTVDVDTLEELTNEVVEDLIKLGNANKKKQQPKERKVVAHFLEWGGTRNHPKAYDIVEEGTIVGNWFIRKNGSKKSINAKGFYIVEEK